MGPLAYLVPPLVLLLTGLCGASPVLENDDATIGNAIDEGIFGEEYHPLFDPVEAEAQEALDRVDSEADALRDQNSYVTFRIVQPAQPDGPPFGAFQSVLNRRLQPPTREFQASPAQDILQAVLNRHLEPPTQEFYAVTADAPSPVKVPYLKPQPKLSPGKPDPKDAVQLLPDKTVSDTAEMPAFTIGKKIVVRPKNDLVLNVAPTPPGYLVPPTRAFSFITASARRPVTRLVPPTREFQVTRRLPFARRQEAYSPLGARFHLLPRVSLSRER